MKFPNVGPLFRSLAKAFADYQANAKRPPHEPMSRADAIAVLDHIEAALPAIRAWVAAHPGAITAADDLVEALASAGVSWAAAVRGGVDGAADGLETAATALSWIEAFLKATAPVPVPPGGMGRRVGRG